MTDHHPMGLRDWYYFRNHHPLAMRLKDHDRRRGPERNPWGGLAMEWTDEHMDKIIEEWVSWEWQHAVCTCPSATYRNGDYTTCTTCGKMARHNLYICKGCNKKQCLRFTWPGQSLKDVKYCYYCMVKMHGKIEGAVPPKWEPRELGSITDTFSESEELFAGLDALEFDL